MQTLTKTYMVAIEGYNHMTIVDEHMNWMKLTHLFAKFFSKSQGPFYTSTFTSKKLIALFK